MDLQAVSTLLEYCKHWGDDGILADAGMIPLGAEEAAEMKARMTDLPVLVAADLK